MNLQVASVITGQSHPTLQADILGDWREEVVMPSEDSTELRIYSTTIPTDYRIYTLMHDPVYRLGIAWQNVAYNQPPHISFYLGEDIRDEVLARGLNTPNIYYTEKIAPTAPGNLSITYIGRTTATLTWKPATDNVMVEGYEIYANGVLHGRTANLSYTITGLRSGTEYTFTVYAYDISGNRSKAATITATTTSGSSGSRPSTKPQPTPSPTPTVIPKQTVEVPKPVINTETGEATVTVNKNALISTFEKAQPDESGVKPYLLKYLKLRVQCPMLLVLMHRF